MADLTPETDINLDTWKIVHANWYPHLPPLEDFRSGKHRLKRLILIAWADSATRYAGAFFNIAQLSDDWDWDYGTPHFAVDLTKPPGQAMRFLRHAVSFNGGPTDLTEHYQA